MKAYYGEYSFYIKRAAKALGLNMTQMGRLILEDVGRPNRTDDEIRLNALRQSEWVAYTEGAHHLFIQGEELANALKTSTITFEPRMLDVLSVEMHHNLPVIIHTCGRRAGALLVCFVASFNTLVIADKEGFVSRYNSNWGPSEPETLVLSLALYMHAFPQHVKDGFPEDMKHPAHARGKKCSTISLTDKLLAAARRCPGVHLRRWHWRLLQSPVFTHMRGKSILIDFCRIGSGTVRTVQQ